jgi:type II secretory pathway pseudopilin PulG
VRPSIRRSQEGSTLIEVIVAVALLLILAMGVLGALDHADARGVEQKAKSIAGNLAQAEQERLRALPLQELSNHPARARRSSTARRSTSSRAPSG